MAIFSTAFVLLYFFGSSLAVEGKGINFVSLESFV